MGQAPRKDTSCAPGFLPSLLTGAEPTTASAQAAGSLPATTPQARTLLCPSQARGDHAWSSWWTRPQHCRGQGRSWLLSLPWKAPHLIESRDRSPNRSPGHTSPSNPDTPDASKSQEVSTNTSTHSGLLASLQSLHPHPQSQWNTLTGCQRAHPATLENTREARLEDPAWEGCARQVRACLWV